MLKVKRFEYHSIRGTAAEAVFRLQHSHIVSQFSKKIRIYNYTPIPDVYLCRSQSSFCLPETFLRALSERFVGITASMPPYVTVSKSPTQNNLKFFSAWEARSYSLDHSVIPCSAWICGLPSQILILPLRKGESVASYIFFFYAKNVYYSNPFLLNCSPNSFFNAFSCEWVTLMNPICPWSKIHMKHVIRKQTNKKNHW